MCKCNLSPHEALYHVLKYTKAHSNLELSCMLWVLHSLPCTMYERLCAYINQNDAPPILRIKSKIHPHFLWWRPNAMAKTTLDLTMFYVYDLWAVFNLWALANLYIYNISISISPNHIRGAWLSAHPKKRCRWVMKLGRLRQVNVACKWAHLYLHMYARTSQILQALVCKTENGKATLHT